MCIEKAHKYGMGMVAVRNSSHYGIAGYWTGLAAKENMIGISGTNARPSVAPTFGVENMLGTNPLTFSMPTDEPFPFTLDCATSVIQNGKIEYYARINHDTPKGLVISREGEELTDSAEILKKIRSQQQHLLLSVDLVRQPEDIRDTDTLLLLRSFPLLFSPVSS